MAPVVLNASTRVVALLELNNPVVKVKPFRFNVPAVSVVVCVVATVNEPAKVNV
jgi:hypothetical protein